MKYFALVLLALSSVAHADRSTLSDAEIRKLLIRESVAEYRMTSLVPVWTSGAGVIAA